MTSITVKYTSLFLLTLVVGLSMSGLSYAQSTVNTVEVNNSPPTGPELIVTSSLAGEEGTIDFSGVSDITNDFDDLTIRIIFADDSPIEDAITFLSGYDTVNDRVTDSTVVYRLTSTLSTLTQIDNYNVTDLDGAANNGTFIGRLQFDVQESRCEALILDGVNFGTLVVGQTSDGGSSSFIAINNTGDRNVTTAMLSATNWISQADSAVNVMTADQTRWSLDSNTVYADRTEFTTLLVNILSNSQSIDTNTGPLDVFLQLSVTLIDTAFRGTAEQTLNVSSMCS